MGKLRTAVIGAGKMGRIHAKVYSKLECADLVAVADSNAERAAALAEQLAAAVEALGILPDVREAITVHSAQPQLQLERLLLPLAVAIYRTAPAA